MSVHFVQVNCIEGKKVDLRQAAAVKYKPDIIFFETPSFEGGAHFFAKATKCRHEWMLEY